MTRKVHQKRRNKASIHRSAKLDALLGCFVEVRFIKALGDAPMTGFLDWDIHSRCYTLCVNQFGIGDKHAFRQSYVTSINKMKLKNKRTGEMIETWSGALSVQSGLQIRHYATIAELNEEWEDVQERGYFAIHSDGSVYKHMPSDDGLDDEDGEEIGNCFETREEAELAVKKLKAWKRLRDKGFRFTRYDNANLVIDYSLGDHDESDIPQLVNDLDFLFGGGDE